VSCALQDDETLLACAVNLQAARTELGKKCKRRGISLTAAIAVGAYQVTVLHVYDDRMALRRMSSPDRCLVYNVLRRRRLILQQLHPVHGKACRPDG
jgi:hypothetical protein